MQKTLETKHKTLNTIHYYLKVLYHSLVRGQYLYSRAKPGGIALNYLLYYSLLLASKEGQKEYPWYSFDL